MAARGRGRVASAVSLPAANAVPLMPTDVAKLVSSSMPPALVLSPRISCGKPKTTNVL